jgi:hypothetical protein
VDRRQRRSSIDGARVGGRAICAVLSEHGCAITASTYDEEFVDRFAAEGIVLS